MERLIFSLSFSLLASILYVLCSLKAINVLQLSSYKAKEVVAWLKRTSWELLIRTFTLGFFNLIITLMFCICFPLSPVRYIGCIMFTLLTIYFLRLQKTPSKTPLKFTPRVIRLIILLSLILFALSFVSVYFLFNTSFGYSLIALIAPLTPFICLLSAQICLPIELLINKKYYKKAQKTLQNSQIIKIAITGSYGKTTAKNILSTLLQPKFKVLKSPLSYNTPMGLSRVINDGLNDSEVFIAEMGARQTGDIDQLCKLIKPNYGMITAISNQHLQTFKTIENVQNTKFELAKNCQICVVNSDDSKIMEKCATLNHTFLYCGESGANASFSNVDISNQGTSFLLTIQSQSVQISTKLLGRHIPSLITMCACLAHQLGLSLSEIASASAKIEPIPHRLQLIKNANFTAIDDAYNSNPQGAKNALEILSMFNKPRVVITPGFIELGKAQDQANHQLGQNIASCADYLISINNQQIYSGAKSKDMQNIHQATSLNQAIQTLNSLNLPTPTVLFLNDLPDNY